MAVVKKIEENIIRDMALRHIVSALDSLSDVIIQLDNLNRLIGGFNDELAMLEKLRDNLVWLLKENVGDYGESERKKRLVKWSKGLEW